MGSIARVVTTCMNRRYHRQVEGNRDYMLALFDRALKQSPDLVCFPEDFVNREVAEADLHKMAEPVPGPTTDAFAKRAKAHNCYVICPICTARDGKIYNSAVVIDRSGGILGIYDKVNPVTTSPDYTVFEDGVFPGGEPPVFDLDFGRIGIQICFDVGFPETWEVLARKGARAVFWPSAYDGGFPLQAYAYLHHYYVISSVYTSRSRIINPCGRVMAETDERGVNFIVQDLNLDFLVAQYDFNRGVPARLMDLYPRRVKVTSSQEDGHFLVEPTDPTLTTAQICAELGLESTQEFHDRHREAYGALHAGGQPVPQKAAHGTRDPDS